MKEDFLHYLWKFQKFNPANLVTTEKKPLEIIKQGAHNTENSGPDFFNAQLVIEDQKWAGNIEIHLKSSDWYAHNHQNDTAYDSVILHVVWEYDVDVYRQNNSVIPTLELKPIINPLILKQYQQLLYRSPKWINCENQLNKVSGFTISNWIERLYFERLEDKSNRVKHLFESLSNHWEATCFSLIAKYFGGNTNGAQFAEIANSIPFTVIQKTNSTFQLEALFFGQGNLLNASIDDVYYQKLQQEYNYLKHKYKLPNLSGLQLQFFRLRPTNFPTIRLAQLAALMEKHPRLFSLIHKETSYEKLKLAFKIETSPYWVTHYNFGKETKKSIKRISSSFSDLLILNAVLPIQFYYSKYLKNEVDPTLLQLISSLKPEKNTIVANFNERGITSATAMHSQAVIQLKKEYCDTNQCLKCAIGFELLKGN